MEEGGAGGYSEVCSIKSSGREYSTVTRSPDWTSSRRAVRRCIVLRTSQLPALAGPGCSNSAKSDRYMEVEEL